MTPKLTREQRQAVDEQKGQPVYIVDNERHETFVLLTSSDFERVKLMLRRSSSDGPWTDDKNRRRIELIDKKISGTITQMESVEFADLQLQAETHFDRIAPPPMNGVVELHQQLSNRDNQ